MSVASPFAPLGGGLRRFRPIRRSDAVRLSDSAGRPIGARAGRQQLLRTGDAPIEVRPLGFVPSEPALEALREAAGADEGVREAWLLAGSGGGAADVVLVAVAEGEVDPAPLARVLGQILPSGWSGDVYPIGSVEFAAGDYDAVRRGLQVYP